MSSDTRPRVLAATIASLVEHGAAGTTSSRVARSAGVAEGTIFKLFGTKVGLLAAAAEHVLDDVREQAALAFLAAADSPEHPLDRALRIAWDAYARPDLVAVHELFFLARTDEALAARLVELNVPHRGALHDLAAAALPDEITSIPNFAAIVDVVIDAIANCHLGAANRSDPAGRLARFAVIRRSAHLLLADQSLDLEVAGAVLQGRQLTDTDQGTRP